MRLGLVHRAVMVAMLMYILADLLITYYVEGLKEPHFVTGIRVMIANGDQRSMMFGAAIVAAGLLAWFMSKKYME
jgi:hypothetical protein